MPYIGKSPSFGVRNRFVYLASASDTSVSGADANGATLTFTDGAYVDVYLNGVLLKPGTDYNTNTANTIAGISAMAADDEVTVVVYHVFTVADMVSATSGGTFSGNVTMNGTLDVAGNVSLDGGNFVFNESSADVDFRVESNGESHMLFVDGGNDAVILGHSAKVDGINDDNEGVKGSGGQLQLHGATPVVDFFSYSTTDGTHGGINFMKSANNTIGSTTAVSASDVVGSIAFGGFDGADYASIAGKIDFQMGGSGIGENDTAGEMVFYTTPDGSGGSGSSERMRIESDGTVRITSRDLKIGTGSSFDAQVQFDANSDWLIGIDASDGGYFKFNNSDTMGTNTRITLRAGGEAGFNNVSSPADDDTVGIVLNADGNDGLLSVSRNTNDCAKFNRKGNDGTIIFLQQAGTPEGSISVSGSTVSFNGFTGSHWSRLTDNSKPTILRGTVIETIDEMMDWYQVEFTKPSPNKAKYEEGDTIPEGSAVGDIIPITVKRSIELPNGKSVGDAIEYTDLGEKYTGIIIKEHDIKHVKCKISDTADCANVYGVFLSWDDDDDTVNDMYVNSVGTSVVRIHKDQTVVKGDLITSNGDGTAKKQDDDIIRSKTIGKVLTNIKQETYSDGSYTVPCALYCG